MTYRNLDLYRNMLHRIYVIDSNDNWKIHIKISRMSNIIGDTGWMKEVYL